MPIRAVTIDFHNTLAWCDRWFELEVRELVPELLLTLGPAHGVNVDSALLDRARGEYRLLREGIIASGDERVALDGALATMAALGLDFPRAEVEAAIEVLMRAALAEARPMPGAVEAVRALRASGLRCGIVSSAVHHPFLEWTIARFGLADAFASVVTSASSGYYKSRPEIYHTALRALGVGPEEAVHVGDSYRFDVQGARRAGLRTIWYAGTTVAMEQPDNEADATVADLATLPQVIATLDGGGSRRRWWQRGR
jgi:HAD superfamily hydrolase (TIGR01509 family)